MKREITKAELIINEDNSQELHVYYKGMYINNYIYLTNEEIELLQGIRSTTTGRNLLYKFFNIINQIKL